MSTAIPGGFDRDDFVVDERAGTVTCPAGHTRQDHLEAIRHLRESAAADVRSATRCTNASAWSQAARSLSTMHELVECRQAWRDGEFAEDYRRFRPMVERSIAWLVADAHRTGPLPRGREEPARALGAHRGHQPPTPDQPRSWHTTEAGSSGPPDHGRASPGRQKWDLTFGHCPSRVASF